MNGNEHRFTALDPVGSRGADNQLTRNVGQRYKAFVPVAGAPMLLRVLRTLMASRSVERIALCIDEEALPAAGPELSAVLAAGRISTVPCRSSPVLSVIGLLETRGDWLPLLVTTADHPLLTASMVDYFCSRAAHMDADLIAAVAPAALVRQTHPEAVRTYYRFADQAYCGCNLFILKSPQAGQGVAFWSRLEPYRKRPWRMAWAIGPIALCQFLLGRLSLEAATRRFSEAIGVTVRTVTMPFADAAVDVDSPADLRLAERILCGRR